MDPQFVSLLVFVGVCGSAALGLWLVLPDRHLNSETKEVVRLATGLIGTIAALVLGLLVSSAQSNFDRIDDELMQNAAATLMLDRTLAEYGPEAAESRQLLKTSYARRIDLLFSGKARSEARADGHRAAVREVSLDTRIRSMPAGDSFHEGLQQHALDVLAEIEMRRALMHMQGENSVPAELLLMLVLWLVVIFATFGLFAPGNATVWTALMVCSVSASAAVFLILELNTPFDGLVNIRPEPLRETLALLGEEFPASH